MCLRFSFLLILCIGLTNPLTSQEELGHSYYEKAGYYSGLGKIDSAIYMYELAAKTFLEIDNRCFALQSRSRQAGLQQSNGQLEAMLRTIEIIRQINVEGQETPDCIPDKEINYLLSLYHYDIAQYDSSIQYLEKFIDFPDLSYHDKSIGYHDIGLAYQAMGEYKRAFDYYTYSLNEKMKGKNPTSNGPLYNSLAVVSYRDGKFDRASKFYKKSLTEYTRVFSQNHPRVATVYNNVAHCKMALAQYDSSLFYHKKALKIRLDQLPANHLHTISSYNGMGLVNLQLEDYSEANAHFDKAIALLSSYEDNRYDRFMFTVLINRSVNNQKELAFDTAVLYLEKAEVLIEQATEQGRLNILDALTLEKEMIKCLRNWYAFSAKEDIISQTMTRFDKFDTLVNYQLNTIKPYDYQLDYLSRLNEVYEISVPLAAEAITLGLAEVDLLYQRMEWTKSNLLRTKILRDQSISFSNVSDSLLQKENTMRKEIATLEDVGEDLGEEDQGRLFQLKRSYSDILNSIEEESAALYNLKFNNSVPSLTDVKGYFKNNNQSLLEFFWLEDKLYSVVINRDKTRHQVVSLPENFEELLLEFRTALTMAESVSTFEKFSSLATQLYHILIAPVEELLKEDLIIIPHGNLNHIPFEVLIRSKSENGNFKTADYLLKWHNISYANSASLWAFDSQMDGQEDTKGVLAIAPIFKGVIDANTRRSGGLKWNLTEVEKIENHFKDVMILRENANESTFRKFAESPFQIIHFATHGLLNDNDPMGSKLLLSDETDSIYDNSLSVSELYGLKFSADLVVLSACDSGFGELLNGEGSINLERGFFYAGARSVISSLWPINDFSTSEIMNSLYANLKAGMTKDKGLKEAKLQYLANADEVMAHPYFWAAFTAKGNMSPISVKGLKDWHLLFAILAAILGLLVLLKIRKQKTLISN